jgi:hypothetical protein
LTVISYADEIKMWKNKLKCDISNFG